jgi:hypothetical protein
MWDAVNMGRGDDFCAPGYTGVKETFDSVLNLLYFIESLGSHCGSLIFPHSLVAPKRLGVWHLLRTSALNRSCTCCSIKSFLLWLPSQRLCV